MRKVRVLSVFLALVYVCASSAAAAAQNPTDPPPRVRTGGLNEFNPDIAVVGDFLTAAGKNDVNPAPALDLHESEITFHADVDTYAKADFFVAFGEEGVELEEGYLTFPALPGKFLLRVGKMRAAFGKVNTLHNHLLPWTDRPLVTDNLVGGGEGINDAGFSLSPRLFQIGGVSLDTTLQVFRGDSSSVFLSTKRGDLAYVGRLHSYADINESLNVDGGFSFARGHNDAGIIDGVDVGEFRTTLYGADASVKWRPLSRSIYRGFSARSEVIWSQRGESTGRVDSMGFYVAGEYQFARRWLVGARYDNAQQATDSSIRDKGQSLLLTFRPTEFSQIRGQYRRIDYGGASVANEFLGQFLFIIGAHGAHPFF
jgi:hypothetical protein